MPVYQQGVVEARGTAVVVDNRVGCGQLRWVSVCVRLGVCLLPALFFVFYPSAVSFISSGRTVLWAQMFYFALPLTLVLAVAGVCGLAVFGVRVWRLRSGS